MTYMLFIIVFPYYIRFKNSEVTLSQSLTSTPGTAGCPVKDWMIRLDFYCRYLLQIFAGHISAIHSLLCQGQMIA